MSYVSIKIPVALVRDLIRTAQIALDTDEARTAHPGPEPLPDFGTSRMSDAQRRMIYRLAFQLGHNGDAARDLIKHKLGSDPTKERASSLIDELQAQVRRKADNGGGREAS